MNPRLKRLFNLSGTALAIIGAVFVVIRLGGYYRQINISFNIAVLTVIVTLAVFYSAANIMLAFAWKNILKHLRADISVRNTLYIYGVSQIAKYTPGNIFHLAGRQAMGMAAGIPGWALAKSAAWELGIISLAGALWGIWAMPLLMPELSYFLTGIAFVASVVAVLLLAGRYAGKNIARAFCMYIVFLFCSGMVFVAMLSVLLPAGSTVPWLPVCGAYVLAWLIGLITPGAPAGVGIRELALLFVLKGVISEADLLLAVVIGRGITVIGDFIFLLVGGMAYKMKKYPPAADHSTARQSTIN